MNGTRGGRWAAILLAGALAGGSAGCDYPFEPFQEPEGVVFSIFGYLDIKADTQWIRVMPIRQNLLLEPGPIDAVVTLEEEGAARSITLRDSLFGYFDPRLDGTAYAHNFWTTEPLTPGATYRLRAARSDGATAVATVEMPEDLEISFMTGPGIGSETALLHVRAEHVLLVEVYFAMSRMPEGDRTEPIVIREDGIFPTNDPDVRSIAVSGDTLEREGLLDVRRQEIHLAVSTADWPFDPDMPDVVVSLPGTMPSNVENGLGFVGGVATWTIPFHRCAGVIDGADGEPFCRTTFNARSATVEGTLRWERCGTPSPLTPILLTERFPSGRETTRWWRSGWDGTYRFEGIEPGAELELRLLPGEPPIPLPPLTAGEHRTLEDVLVPGEC